MYSILKHTHLTFILLAVIMFILRFYWLKSGHENAQKALYKKIHIHTNVTILLLGFALMGLAHFNPFSEGGYWLLEKMLAFVAYFIMVQKALSDKSASHIQWLTFIGAFGWLAYIAKLGFTKQAILFVG